MGASDARDGQRGRPGCASPKGGKSMPEHSSQSNGLHTGMNAPRSGFYKAKNTGEIIQTEEGNHLPPDPKSNDSTE